MDIEYLSLAHCADNILRLTKLMLTQAQTQGWDTLATLEADRSEAMTALFEHPDIEASLPILSSTLYEVLELDKETIRLTEKERLTVLNSLHHQSKGDYALSVYRKTQSAR